MTATTWQIGDIVANTRAGVFARVKKISATSIQLEELETVSGWNHSARRETMAPGDCTGRVYRRQIQTGTNGEMTCKAGPARSTARLNLFAGVK